MPCGEGFSLSELRIRSNKDKPYECGFSGELLDRSNSYNLLGMGHVGCPKSILFPPVVVRLLAIKGYGRAGKEWGGAGQVKKLQNMLFLLRSSHFFLNRYSLNCCNPLINFQSSEKVDFDISATDLVAWMEKQIFRGPNSVIPKTLPSVTCFLA